MAAVNYYGILETLRDIFKADPRTADAQVYIERDPSVDVLGAQKGIIIYLESRKPTDNQPIAAGKRTRYELSISVWAFGYSIDVGESCSIRDELTGQVELVLLANRTIRDKVAFSFLKGGKFLSVSNEGYIFASAETEVVAEVTASYG